MTAHGMWSAGHWILAETQTADSATDWWRIIALTAVTAATVAILALLFRPGVLSHRSPPEPVEPQPAPAHDEPRKPGLYPLPTWTAAEETIDAARAAERLRQVVSQATASEVERRRLGGRREKERNGREASSPGPARPDRQLTESKDASMETVEPGIVESGQGVDAEHVASGDLQEQIDRYFSRAVRPANVVQFTPRKQGPGDEQVRPARGRRRTDGRAAQDREIAQFPVDTATRDGITATVQELLFCANVGELLHGFALYSDRFLFQFMDESRLSEDVFRRTYSDIPAKDPNDWIRIDAVSGFTRLPDGRIVVRVRYIDGAEIDGTEHLTMKFDAHVDRWLIDDIRTD